MIYEDDVVMDNEFSEFDEIQDSRLNDCLYSSDDEDEDSFYYNGYPEDNYPEEDEEEKDEIDEEYEARKLKDSQYKGDENKYRFFKRECEKLYEFNRTPVTFRLKKDSTDYHGIVLKELDKSHFIFLIDDSESPKEQKMKKIDITDISIYY